MHQEYKNIIEELNNCRAECNHCYNACFSEQDVKMMARCIQLNRNCADICSLTAAFLESGSELRHDLLRLCSEICNTCAVSGCFLRAGFIGEDPSELFSTPPPEKHKMLIDAVDDLIEIVASKVRINALVSIIVVLIGSALWGIPGMFLSIPLTAILKVIFDHIDSLKPWGFLLGNTVPTKPKKIFIKKSEVAPD